jgi:predicted Zn-dependent peptidase
MDLITEAITEPLQCPHEFAQNKRAYQAELAARYDMDATLAWLWLSRRLFHKHPWLRAGVAITAEDIDLIEIDDIKEIWAELFSPRRLLPCLTTDLTTHQVTPSLQTLSDRLGHLNLTSSSGTLIKPHGVTHEGSDDQEISPHHSSPLLCRIQSLTPLSEANLTLVHKAGRKQAMVFIAQPSLSPHHPDHLILSLAICALGGTFSSPLMQEIRVKRGLSYGAHAGVRGEGEARYITFHATPEAPDVIETVSVMHQVLSRGAQGDLSDGEISFAKDYLINAHPFNIETPAMRTALIARAQLQGLDPNEVLNIPQRLSAITPDQVRDVAMTHLSTQGLEVLVLGDHSSGGSLGDLVKGLSRMWSFAQVIHTDAMSSPQSVWG